MERISLKGKYISIAERNGRKSFGGSQEWYPGSVRQNVKGQGCGLIAAVDCALYISGVDSLNIEEYNSFVEQFLNERRLAGFCLREFQIRKYDNLIFSLGILPIQISKYLNKRMRILGSQKRFRWNGIHGHKDMYDKIKNMISADIPVIWALYSPGRRIKMYTGRESDGTFIDRQIYINNHYVTITGVLENKAEKSCHARMLEVSSWGKKYYIDFDEYLAYVTGSIVSRYCSNIMYFK